VTRALLSREAEPARAPGAKSRPAKAQSKFRVSQPGDAFEQEADRAASVVASGKRLGGWSLSQVNMEELQRQDSPPQSPSPGPKPDNYGEAAGKLAEAFLKTDLGKKITAAVSNDKLFKGSEDPGAKIAALAVVGAEAVAAVAGMAATHTPLPAQIPDIPLDKLKPGLKVKITYEGPVDRPTKATISLSYTPSGGAGAKKPAKTRAELQREENARVAADQQKFRDSLKYPPGSPQDLAQKQEAKMMEDWTLRKFGAVPGTGGRPLVPPAAGPAASPPKSGAGELHMPTFESPFHPKAPTLLDKRLELHHEDSKREEPAAAIQRKASSGEPALDTSGVADVLSSGGRLLDHETRRFMENRFGYDFSRVRVHNDSAASASARALRARAYTVGNDIVFGAGRYAPRTNEGRRLLAHELTHVVQQTPGAARKPVRMRPAPVKVAPRQVQRDVDQDTDDRGGWFPHPIEKAKKVIRHLPGYMLFSLIVGKDLITGERVEFTPTKLLQALLNVVPGGDGIFAKIQESGALDKAYAWVKDQLDQRGLNWDYFKSVFDEAIGSVSVSDIKDIGGAIERIKGIFAPAFEKVISFAKAVANKVFELIVQVVMERLGGAKVLEILRKAGETFLVIAKDPVNFLKNLLGALAQGFTQFKDKILDYLKEGVKEWIFGQIAPGLKLPKTISVKSILGLILQVLGLTWDNFRKRLVGMIGEDAVAFLEGAFDFLMKLAKAKDLSEAWEMIVDKAKDLMDTVLGAIKQWVVTKIVTAAIQQLAPLFIPVTAVLKAIETVYTTVTFFIEKIKQMAALVEAVTNSLAAIAAGDITKAANFVEASLARTIPLVLGFLADLLHLGGIAEQIRNIIQKVKDKIDGAIDGILKWIIDKGKAFYDKAKQTAGKVLEWWKQRKDLLIGDEEHAIYMDGTEDEPTLMIASEGVRWSTYLEGRARKATSQKDKDNIRDVKKKAKELEERMGPSKDDKEKADKVEKKRTLFAEIAKEIQALGLSDEALAPASVIEYDKPRALDEGGQMMKATVLSSVHPKGTTVRDKPKIWTALGDLAKDKNYVQGHLLNRELGGPGLRFNLTPINQSANANHRVQVEDKVKTAVNGKPPSVMSYQVKVKYEKGAHKKPKRMKELEDIEAKTGLGKKRQQELETYQAEQNLCTGLEYDARFLKYDTGSNKWVEDTKEKPIQGTVPHELDD
jgi:hypothetical protein